MTDERITRDDLEHKLREIEDRVEETKQNARNIGVAVAVGVAVVVVSAYLVGRWIRRRHTRVVVYRL